MHKTVRNVLSLFIVLAFALSVLPLDAALAAPNHYVTPGATVFINEIHYDNDGTDAGEAVEVAGPAGTDLTGWSIVLYNGTGGVVYDTDTLSGTIPDLGGGYGTVFLSYPSNGIQNGALDGVALVNNSTVVMFLSYEGTFAATAGPASGLTSTDIGVAETATTTIGSSLQLTGTGTTYDDFTWAAAAPSTFGAVNNGQSFGVVGNQPVTLTCGVDINILLGTEVTRQITASDSDGIVASLTAVGLVDGITLTDIAPAVEIGGTASATLAVAKTVPAGNYAVSVTATNNDDPQQTDTCTVNITVVDVVNIYKIQGSGTAAAITGTVVTEGIVVGDYEGPSPSLRGFYIQDPTGDSDTATSDGIFVFNGSNNSVALGDLVRVTGTAADYQDQTQITASSVEVLGTGSVSPVDVAFPVPSMTYLEQFEGMLVRLPQTMMVTEHFQLGRFGQVVISADARLQQPTNVLRPGPNAAALQELNNRSKIILDDHLNSQNPDTIIFSRDDTVLSAINTLRGGDTITGAVGVLTYTWSGNSISGNAYRLRPIGALNGTFDFVAANPRPESAPEVSGELKVVGMNVLNLFNTFTGCTLGVDGAATDCRGADNLTEFERQWPKTVAAILKINPDVLGVNEIENDGYGSESAIAFLVNKLNEATAPGTYAFIDADARTSQVNALGTDAIKVGLIYKTANVSPVGQTAALNSVAFVNGGDTGPRNRPSLIQAFQDNGTGHKFIVSINHLKSKSSSCDVPDAGDGQSNCNIVRVNAVNELLSYLATDPTGTGDPDVLIIGDLNSYAKEDPITALQAAGYANLVEAFLGPDAYSYVFDGQWGYLDHAIGSPSIVSQVAGVSEYHINADEPSVLDYNTNFKTTGQIDSLYAPDEFRTSDHDPVIVGLTLTSAPVNTAPVAGDDAYEVGEDGYLTVEAPGVLENDTDAEGDDLNAAVYEQPLTGFVEMQASGQFTFMPDTNFTGTETFTYTVSDGEFTDVGTVTITVTPVDDLPYATITMDPAAPKEGDTVTFTAGLIDPDTGQPVAFSPNAVINWEIKGDTTIAGNPALHTFTDEGTHLVTLTVSDPVHGDSSINKVVTVSNVAPVIASIAPITIAEREWVTQEGSFTDPGVDDTWTATVNYDDGAGLQPLVLEEDGTFNLSHQYWEPGEYEISITVSDGDGGSDTLIVIVTVENLNFLYMPFLSR